MIQVGDTAHWKWGNGMAEAQVEELHPEPTTILTKGAKVTRNGTMDNPAVIMKNKKGVKILKLESEIDKK